MWYCFRVYTDKLISKGDKKSNLNNEANAIDELDFYIIEYRKYEHKKNFKHYQAFFDKSETIISYLEKHLNDEEIDAEKWIDVTSEFTE